MTVIPLRPVSYVDRLTRVLRRHGITPEIVDGWDDHLWAFAASLANTELPDEHPPLPNTAVRVAVRHALEVRRHR